VSHNFAFIVEVEIVGTTQAYFLIDQSKSSSGKPSGFVVQQTSTSSGKKKIGL